MSSRRPADPTSINAMQLRAELQQLKEAHIAAEAAGRQAEVEAVAGPPSPKNVEATPAGPTFDQLAPAEQAAASLGVHPEAWKPIKFMNNEHYRQLLQGNAVSEDLARRIAAFKHVSTQ